MTQVWGDRARLVAGELQELVRLQFDEPRAVILSADFPTGTNVAVSYVVTTGYGRTSTQDEYLELPRLVSGSSIKVSARMLLGQGTVRVCATPVESARPALTPLTQESVLFLPAVATVVVAAPPGEATHATAMTGDAVAPFAQQLALVQTVGAVDRFSRCNDTIAPIIRSASAWAVFRSVAVNGESVLLTWLR